MAEPVKILQRQVSELGSSPKNHANPSKFTQFLLKSFFIAIAIAVLPFIPFRAPEFINRTVLNRSWELLYLVFIGIAVSYGLFSRRYTESEKETQMDTTQKYVSKILQVSPVFDEDVESPSGSDHGKVQTWNAQYFPLDSVVMVADQDSGMNKDFNSNKPLFLPVRSLKSSLSDPEVLDSVNGIEGFSGSDSGFSYGLNSGSGSGFRGSDSPVKVKHGKNGGTKVLNPLVLEEKLKETGVLPSPIPWRSRSGRMEVKDELGFPQYSLPPAVTESSTLPLRSPVPWQSRPNSSATPTPKLSPSPSLSPELRAKNSEDLGKKNCSYKSPVNPLPVDEFLSEKKDAGKSFRSESFPEKKHSRKISREELQSNNGSKRISPNSVRIQENQYGSLIRKSVPTIRANECRESSEYLMEEKSRKSAEIEAGMVEKQGRKIREFETVEYAMVEKTGRVIRENTEVEVSMTGKSVKRTGSDRSFSRAAIETDNKVKREIPPPPPLPSFKKENEVVEKIIIKQDDWDSESDKSDTEIETLDTFAETEIGENEVDKKADEFIAKFREQIRLQRIETLKRASGMRSKNQS